MEMIERTFEVRYLETWLPPRCRRLRYRVVEEDMTFGIRSYSADEAPVAFRVSTGSEKFDIRWNGAECYRRASWESGDWSEWLRATHYSLRCDYAPYKAGDMTANGPENGRTDLVSEVEASLSRVCLVDGELWEGCQEPGWKPDTWYSGSCFYLDIRAATGADARWNALQWEEALASASARLRKPAVPILDQPERIEVIIPDAVRSDPHGKALAEDRAKLEENLAQVREECKRAAEQLAKAMEQEDAYRKAHEGAPWLHPAA